VSSAVVAVQGRLDLAVGNTRPFVNLNAAMALLNLDAFEVESLWVFNHLQFAFNIASQGAQTREVRIATQSIRAYLAGYRYDKKKPEPANALEIFLDSLWPQRRDTIRLSQFYRTINCAPKHALDLRREGHFGVPPAQTPLARKDSPYIIRHLAIQFLRTRRLP
jgi:hypothetical protein